MSTKISWAEETWNPIIGCSKISAGCKNCYAERMAYRLACMGKKHYPDVVRYLPTDETRWNGKTVFVESALTKPLHWKTPRKIFVVSMGDLFYKSVPFEWIDRVFAVMALCPQHTFLLLTKRADRMREYCGDLLARTPGMDKAARELGLPHNEFMYPHGAKAGVYQFSLPLPNVHGGVTVENQDNIGRIADLIWTPTAHRFLSLEPLLGPIDLNSVTGSVTFAGDGKDWPRQTRPLDMKVLYGHATESPMDDEDGKPIYYSAPTGTIPKIDYVFLGCESKVPAKGKRGHRPLCTLDDIRHVMQQCRDAGVKIHVKQIPLNGRCNKQFAEWPEQFRVREV